MNRRRSVVLEPSTEVVEVGTPPSSPAAEPIFVTEEKRALLAARLKHKQLPQAVAEKYQGAKPSPLAEKLLAEYEKLLHEALATAATPPATAQYGWSPQQPLFGLPAGGAELVTADKVHFMSLQQWLVEPVPVPPSNAEAVAATGQRMQDLITKQLFELPATFGSPTK